MEIQLRPEVLALTHRMSEIIAHHTGKPVDQVARDIDRDHYMTAEEARDYGIIDDIILPRRGVAAAERDLQVARPHCAGRQCPSHSGASAPQSPASHGCLGSPWLTSPRASTQARAQTRLPLRWPGELRQLCTRALGPVLW